MAALKKGPLRAIRRSLKVALIRMLGKTRRDGEMTPIGQVDWSIVRKVLLVRPNYHMGNLLMAITALPILRHNFPEAQIDLLCMADSKALLAGHPDLDQAHTFDRKTLTNPFRLFRMMKKVHLEDYDLVIDGTMSGTAALLTKLSDGWIRIGAGPETRHYAYTTLVPEPPHSIWRVRALHEYFRSMGLKIPENLQPKIEMSPPEMEKAQERLHRMGWSEDTWVTGVHVTSPKERRWPAERWARVITGLWDARSDNEGLVIFHDAEDLDVIESLEEMIPGDIPIFFSKNLRQTAAMMSLCHQFVAHSSDPMHMACALGVPVVSIFEDNTWARLAPQRDGIDVCVQSEESVTPEEVIAGHRRQREMLNASHDGTAGALG